MSVFHNNALIGAGAGTGAAAAAGVATKSLRFNSGDSAHLNRTPSSAGNRKTFTWAGWIKKAGQGNYQKFFFGGTTSDEHGFRFENTDQLSVYRYSGGFTFQVKTTRVFRDPAAFFHLCVAYDSSQSTAADRVKIYINGIEETDFATSNYPSQNSQYGINNTVDHSIGRLSGAPSSEHFDGYLADVYFIDGSAVSPVNNFIELDSNGVYQARAYSGTFGTNGFHLAFSDATSDAALGTDSSGNSNTFTVNNLVATNNTNSKGHGAVAYTGNNTARSITGFSFQPDFLWIKDRGSSYHILTDVARGLNKQLYSNDKSTEGSNTDRVTSFDTNGFSIAANTSSGGVNTNNSNYIAWAWKAGGATASNTDGTITANVSANDTYGFSIIQFLGNATSGATVGHGLSAAPEWIIGKNRGGGDSIWVWHKSHSPSAQSFLKLESDAAEAQSQYIANNTAPSSSVITLGSDYGWNSSQSPGMIMFAWRSISGFSKFGSYTGNGNTSGSGPRVELGFKPAWLLVKGANVQSGWRIYDSTRDPGGQFQKRLYAESSGGESTNSSQYVNYDDTGFDVEASGSLSTYNVSGKTYIYMAFAQDPGGDVIDSLLDVPTNGDQADTGAGGEVSGNYCTWNPNHPTFATTSFSNGNLDTSLRFTNGSITPYATGTIAVSSGKWYWEITLKQESNDTEYIGVMDGSHASGAWSFSVIGAYFSDARKAVAASPSSYGATYTTGDVIGVALDADNGNLEFYKNGVSQGTAATGMTFDSYKAFTSANGTGTAQLVSANFGQRAFKYQNAGTNRPAATYKALCTTNLPTPTIANGRDHFYALASTGTFGGGTVTNSDANFTPDWVWVKRRNAAERHKLYDSVRGTDGTRYKHLESDGTDAEGSGETGITEFVAGGYKSEGGGHINSDGQPFISWMWNAGANSNKTYTVKVVSDSGNKYRFDDFGTSAVTLDLAEGSTYIFDQSDSSNSGHPIRFGTSANGTDYTAGVTHTGTPGSSGAKTTLVLPPIRSNSLTTNAGDNFDSSGAKTKAFDGDASTKAYTANNSDGTTQNTSYIQFNSTVAFSGNLKVKCDNGNAIYDVTSGSTLLATNNTGSDGQTINCGTISNVSKIRVLMAGGSRPAIYAIYIDDVILEDGAPTLYYSCQYHSGMGGQINTNSTAGASNFDGATQTTVKANLDAGFSIVTYTGSGSSTASYGHGLGAEPHLVITKKRDGANDWYIYFKALGNGKFISLNVNSAAGSLSNYWGTVNSTVFSQTYGSAGPNNGSQVAYCFTPIKGFSHFTTFEGTGSSDPIYVHCGFRPAFILRKNADAEKNWYLHDTTRDTFNVCTKEFQPHSSSAEGDHDAMDILSNGFAMRTGNAQHNNSGSTHIVIAFAENPFQANGGLAR